ncbi:DUF305 domain-containing protein (plasmid) [Rubrobacter marinus]|uniref:DUF305 domain-containing protein n=1 Tax=Rubrobacter marinus TaxID=2653852 RepID=A0A6G8Q3K5_9ACTN|nr:DUF305 domain-containing protein [Rubrobacter marinus]QIN81010.1 DUF305 domain-containing protein [Rubrobacter marinus]
MVAGLVAAALLVVGGGAVYAQGQGSSMMGGNNAESGADGGSMGGMMDGGQMGSMMGGGGGVDSMMSEGMMSSFDEEQPFDLQFIDGMTMHHEGAIVSSEHMISDSERPELRRLAENIRQSQSEQVKQMQAWREEWYPDAGRTSGMPAGMMNEVMGDGSMMEGMMGGSLQETMGGNATDEMFLRMMIPHHQMAVDMAEKALKEADHPELGKLARTIRDEQAAEIELMKGYLDEIEAAGNGQEDRKPEAGEQHHGH